MLDLAPWRARGPSYALSWLSERRREVEAAICGATTGAGDQITFSEDHCPRGVENLKSWGEAGSIPDRPDDIAASVRRRVLDPRQDGVVRVPTEQGADAHSGADVGRVAHEGRRWERQLTGAERGDGRRGRQGRSGTESSV